ncbi:MAG: glucuronate isomerase [Acidobacteria bacterium]|nr:glucuronate isomerase [Acidobacteriota bacterium]
MPFIHDDFLLSTAAARRLYHDYAAAEPILDYHNHLPPKDIAQNRQFANLFEIWLEGDHYKWRAMRANGTTERYCTGDAEPYEKFLAYARTVPQTLRNPLYHWTHLELARYFGITDLLDEASAPAIWEQANAQLPGLKAQDTLIRFNVRALCTTDDPADDLNWHRDIAASGLAVKVFPAYRPDKALRVDDPAALKAWIERLAVTANTEITSYRSFLDALSKRHQEFHLIGCRVSDHGLATCFDTPADDTKAATIFDRARANIAATPAEHALFASTLMLHFGRWDAEKGWTKQLHLGARRNNNTRMFKQLGPDTGFDSMGDYRQADALCNYLDALDRENTLPRTIVYNNNPVDNYAFATAIGNFQDGSVAGKVQFGSGWWFLDQKEGMELQLNALSNCGLLARFVGMLTDSRSFMSFPRHEYFRRTLCNLLGRDIENGELPGDLRLVGGMVKNICYGNAREYLRLPGVE